MPKEIESGKFIETRSDIIVIPKQDIEFPAHPSPKTEDVSDKEPDRMTEDVSDKEPDRMTEDVSNKEPDRMTEFIHKEGFKIITNNPEQYCLLVDDGLGIGMFGSVKEIYDYVKNGYPAADIQKWKSFLAANECPHDFHKLPPEVWNKWDELPEKVKQAIRENGSDSVYTRIMEKIKTGERLIYPNPKFKSKPNEREMTQEEQKREDEKCVKYIRDLGFQMGRFGDGEVGIAIDSNNVLGPFASLEDAYNYLKGGYHLGDIESLKKIDGSTVH